MILQSQLNKLAGFETDSYIITSMSIDKNVYSYKLLDMHAICYVKSTGTMEDFKTKITIPKNEKDIRIMSYGQLKFVDNSCINSYNHIISHLSNFEFAHDSLIIAAINTKTGLLSLEDCNNKKPNWLISLTNEENIRDLDNYKI